MECIFGQQKFNYEFNRTIRIENSTSRETPTNFCVLAQIRDPTVDVHVPFFGAKRKHEIRNQQNRQH